MEALSSPSNWSALEIRFALARRGWSLRKLSLKHGLAPRTLADVLRRPWPRGEQLIADVIGVPPNLIWPSRYAARAKRSGGQHAA
jgi:Ner family transcriptional regulator